ncbi:hypothetical protein ATE84_3930 [Aquimarina sp. MAR_2010_214]|nr:hypothetical protein ATE84_3930 [Aquimarina sp. MAR_2010_214]
MKIIKVLFVILFFSTMFMACEAESINDEVRLEVNDTIGSEDENDNTQPK